MKKLINGSWNEAVASYTGKKDADFHAQQYRDRGWFAKVTRVKSGGNVSYVVWVQENNIRDDWKVQGYRKKRKKDYDLDDKGKTVKLFKEKGERAEKPEKTEKKEKTIIHKPHRPSKVGKYVKKQAGKALKHLRKPIDKPNSVKKRAKKFGNLLFGKHKKWVGRF